MGVGGMSESRKGEDAFVDIPRLGRQSFAIAYRMDMLAGNGESRPMEFRGIDGAPDSSATTGAPHR